MIIDFKRPKRIGTIEVAGDSAYSACSSGGCHPQSHENLLSESVRQKVATHPCYSEKAHHHFARMHVAVAPACNIQCRYCNRKYDCANESRPGVVSELLHPEQAVKKVLAVAAAIPQLSVLGIAGPGDPLANPERTFETFRLLSERVPDLKLCLSTNGLRLPELIDKIVQYHIDHVTITINTLDPDMGAEIYSWVYWKNRRLRGRQAALALIEAQQEGLEKLVAHEILVKVNSVMIPGINDHHLKEVSQVVKAKGAFLHNIMPLISAPEHGTYYGVIGQRQPTPEELQTLQDSCSGSMAVMRHCRQCRADAVGLLGEDRGAEFALEKIDSIEIDEQAALHRRSEMRQSLLKKLEGQPILYPSPTDQPPMSRPVKMAVATTGGGIINQHFGHAKEFLVYEVSAGAIRLLGHRKTDLYCHGLEACEDHETTLNKTIAMLSDCETILCAKIGWSPWNSLEKAGIMPNGEHTMEPIEEALRVVYQEMEKSGKLMTSLPMMRKLA